MIDIELLASRLADITGDAAKLAIAIIATVETDAFRADAEWRTRLSRNIFLSPAVIANALNELAEIGLIDLAKRVNVTRACQTPSTLSRSARRPPPGSSSAPSETIGEPTSASDASLRASEHDVASSDGAPSLGATTRPASRSPRREPQLSLAERMQADASEAAAKAELAAVTKQAIDAFDAAFREAYDGAKPTWDARAFGVMQSLVVKHSIAEVLRRMSIMFTAPPRWPPPPYNLQSFSMHFDRFANPTSTGGVIDRGRGGENYYGPVTEVTRG